MAAEKKFQHITVTPEDEDVVIYAGAPSPEKVAEELPEESGYEDVEEALAYEDRPSAASEGEADETEPASDLPDETGYEDVVEALGDEALEDEEREQKPDKPLAKTAPQTKKDDYHETTLEDLKTTKMSMMQKVIIVVAIVAVIAFTVYWFAFH